MRHHSFLGSVFSLSHRPVVLAALVTLGLAGFASGQTPGTRLKSFGGPSVFVGNGPRAGLTDGGDGYLYGVTQNGGAVNNGTVFKVRKDGTGYTNLVSLRNNPEGTTPMGHLLLGVDGLLYGTAYSGGTNGFGSIFRLNRDGTGYTNFFHFKSSPNTELRNPAAGLVQGPDGSLYGVAVNGGGNTNFGSVFKIQTNGAGFTPLYHFGGTTADGRNPNTILLRGTDNTLYGTTPSGGTNNVGVAYRLNMDGTGFTNIYTFRTISNDSRTPNALIQGLDGRLYGTGQVGGSNGVGAVFRMNTDGTGYTNLFHFRNTVASQPYVPVSALVQGPDGVLYGTTQSGGSNFVGAIFKVNADGTGFTNIYTFQRDGDGINPTLSLVLDGSMLYGGTQAGGSYNMGMVYRLNTDGSAYTALLNFAGLANGEPINPGAGLLRGSDGRLYGTTPVGGQYNLGSIYRIDANGTGFTNLHSFKGQNLFGVAAADGAGPNTTLIEGQDGGIYGVTPNGGTNGGGMVFSINKDGTGYRNVLSFGNATTTPRSPRYIMQWSDGLLYGVVGFGGISNFGAVYVISTNGGNVTNLHSFLGTVGGDGNSPQHLIAGLDGRLYGTTSIGGSSNLGTVFGLNRDGTGYTNFYSFRGVAGADGLNPVPPLLPRNDGFLYGVTFGGGTNSAGTIYRLSTNGTGYAVLQHLKNLAGEARNPNGPLLAGLDGYLYGLGSGGGLNGSGSLFRVTTNGTELTVMNSFRNNTNAEGFGPVGALVQTPDGTLYGAANGGGEFNFGALFSLVLDVPPSITVPPQDLWGECNVKSNLTFSFSYLGTPPFQFLWRFNGTPIPGATGATFTVIGSTQANVGLYTVQMTNAYGDTFGNGSIIGFRDTQPATFQLFGANPLLLNMGAPYVEPGFLATDACTSNLTAFATTNIVINTNVPGTYTVTYTVMDSSGNIGSANRTVWVLYRDPSVTAQALFGGAVNPGGTPTFVMFQYGLSTAYGLSTPWISHGSGTNTLPFTAAVTGLDRNLTYQYRQVTSNTLGTVIFGPNQALSANPLLRPGDLNGDNAVDLNELNQVLQKYRNLVP